MEVEEGQVWVWDDRLWCRVERLECGGKLVYSGPYGWTGACSVYQWEAWCRNGRLATADEILKIDAIRGVATSEGE